VRRFQKGEWESLWNQTLKHNNRELAHGAKKLDGNAPAPASIRARARYAEYCARKGALSKANQAMTSDLTPSAAPTNINELRAKNPEPTHPNRDPITQQASLIWPPKNQNISILPAIMSTSTRMQGEFLRPLFLQAHRETEAYFTAAGMSSQRNQSDSFLFKCAAFYQSLKSKVGLAAAKQRR
jgi:hypothetical protein